MKNHAWRYVEQSVVQAGTTEVGVFLRVCRKCRVSHVHRVAADTWKVENAYRYPGQEWVVTTKSVPSCLVTDADAPSEAHGPKVKQLRVKVRRASVCAYCHKKRVYKPGDAICGPCHDRGIDIAALCQACRPLPRFQCPACGRYQSNVPDKPCDECRGSSVK